jgi:hypothetical protein
VCPRVHTVRNILLRKRNKNELLIITTFLFLLFFFHWAPVANAARCTVAVGLLYEARL